MHTVKEQRAKDVRLGDIAYVWTGSIVNCLAFALAISPPHPLSSRLGTSACHLVSSSSSVAELTRYCPTNTARLSRTSSRPLPPIQCNRSSATSCDSVVCVVVYQQAAPNPSRKIARLSMTLGFGSSSRLFSSPLFAWTPLSSPPSTLLYGWYLTYTSRTVESS
jgi:hypothetical protein